MTTTTNTIQELAREAHGYFELKTRDDGTTYYSTPKHAPEWVGTLIYEGHTDYDARVMFPDDQRYELIMRALEWIADEGTDEAHEYAETAVPHATSDHIEWLASHAWRPAYVDEATAELGPADDIMHAIARGIATEALEVHAQVVAALEVHAATL